MTDVRGARILRLLADPEPHGELLLVGMAMAAKLDLAPRKPDFFPLLVQDIWPEWPDRMRRLMGVIADDARTYRAPSAGRKCTAPMRRRAGWCGKNWSTGGWTTDWSTGERTWIAACNRHRPWVDEEMAANYAAKPEGDVPLPCANSGGVLAQHFPELNWYSLWRKCAPRWVQHPEVKPWPKPTLEVVLGEGVDDGDLDEPRPALSLLRPS
ncbi:MAG: hypothetical protein ACRDQD_27295 [Nocardioidaceae bacterium]